MEDFYLKMKIFNRWGNKVYDEEGKISELQGWDGTYKGEHLTSQNFVYFVEVDCVTDSGEIKKFQKKGNVLLLR